MTKTTTTDLAHAEPESGPPLMHGYMIDEDDDGSTEGALFEPAAVAYAPPCPPWCTDELGCDEWNQYNDHQQRYHETPLSKMEPRYPEGRGELKSRGQYFLDEGLRVDWTQRAVQHELSAPAISVRVAERAPDDHWHEAELRMTADDAPELADLLTQAADRLCQINPAESFREASGEVA
jgi:hypothetical protein